MEQSTSVSLQEVKQAAYDYLLLDDENLVEIPLAVFVANKLPADPLWMFITGPPSNAKTEILMAMNGHSQTKFLSSLTPNTLISGEETKDKYGNKVNCSLLPKLDGKLVVIKDFTTVLNMRDDVKAQILSQLREVYDGQTSKAFGTGEFFNWKGKIGVIAAVTPIIDKYTSVHQLLGERFLHYRTDNAKRLATAKRSMANMLADDCHRDKFHAAMTGFIQRFSEPFDVVLQENETLNDRIAG